MQDDEDAKFGEMVIHVDCEKKVRVLDGTVGDDRLFTFAVTGAEGFKAEIPELPVPGSWEPPWAGADDGEETLNTRAKTIEAGKSATLRLSVENRETIIVWCRIKCICANGDCYMAEGLNSPPRMIIPPHHQF